MRRSLKSHIAQRITDSLRIFYIRSEKLSHKSPYSNRFTLVSQSLKMMYDYKLNLVVRTPRAYPWE